MKKFKFIAKVEAGDGGGAYVLFPFDVEKEFGVKGKVPVNATFNGLPYTGSLIKYGHPQHMLGLLKNIREQLAVGPGDLVEVELWKDQEARTLDIPVQFKSAMEKSGVLGFFEALSYTHRKEYCRWISEAKRDDTRARRLEKAVELLGKGIKTPDNTKDL